MPYATSRGAKLYYEERSLDIRVSAAREGSAIIL